MPSIEIIGRSVRYIKPDAMQMDILYRVRKDTVLEIDEADTRIALDFSRIIQTTGIDLSCVSLVEYAMQSACKVTEGEYDCFETVRQYRVDLPMDVHLVVALLHKIAEGFPPQELEVRYILRNSLGEIECLEGTALHNAVRRADKLVSEFGHVTRDDFVIKCTRPRADASYCVYRMKRAEDLHLMRPGLLSLREGMFPIEYSIEALLHTLRP